MRKTVENFVSRHKFAGEYDALFMKHEIRAAQLDRSIGQSITHSVPGPREYSITFSFRAVQRYILRNSRADN